jgi:hypothetical protein
MTESRKIPTETSLLAMLRKGEVAFPPFSLALRPEAKANSPGRELDAVLELTWNGQSRLFAIEYKSTSSPAMVKAAVQQIQSLSRPPLLWPMVLFPYLPEERLQELEREGVSGLDLCGNGVVTVPGEWLVSRTGRPNLYPQSFPIKNVFRGTSSLVARVFLRRISYDAVGEIREEIKRRSGKVAFSTVSKVLARLEEELIVGRQSGKIRLLQPEKLLQRLVENYQPPKIRRRFVGKCSTRADVLLRGRADWLAEDGTALAVTGISSTPFYTAAALEETMSVYCSDIDDVLERLRQVGEEIREQDRFPNLELLETSDDFVYFDPWVRASCPWASPVQTYLELATGGKREQEMAEDIKSVIWRGGPEAIGMDKKS